MLQARADVRKLDAAAAPAPAPAALAGAVATDRAVLDFAKMKLLFGFDPPPEPQDAMEEG